LVPDGEGGFHTTIKVKGLNNDEEGEENED